MKAMKIDLNGKCHKTERDGNKEFPKKLKVNLKLRRVPQLSDLCY